jgi:hypothetical protein
MISTLSSCNVAIRSVDLLNPATTGAVEPVVVVVVVVLKIVLD